LGRPVFRLKNRTNPSFDFFESKADRVGQALISVKNF